MPGSSAPKPPADSAFSQLFLEIGIIDQLVTARFERVLPHGLTSAQFRILSHFSRRGGKQTPAELASAFQVTRATMSSTLQKLIRKGFVKVEPDQQDGRSKRISISPSGLSARNDALEAAAIRFADISDAMATDDAAILTEKLRPLRIWLDENR